MANENTKQKLILAVLQGDDYLDTVDDLTTHGFFSTVLSSVGGFLKKKSVTLMIGVAEDRVEEVLSIIKRNGGRRQEVTYSDVSVPVGTPGTGINMVPVPVHVGGAAVFIVDLEQIVKF